MPVCHARSHVMPAACATSTQPHLTPEGQKALSDVAPNGAVPNDQDGLVLREWPPSANGRATAKATWAQPRNTGREGGGDGLMAVAGGAGWPGQDTACNEACSLLHVVGIVSIFL